MKTLKQLSRLTFILILLAALNACKKDSNNNPDANGSGTYNYLGTATTATRGDYLLADGNTYLYIYGKGATDIVQFIFAKSANITEGTFTYKPAGTLTYDAKKNFSGGSVTTADHPEGVAITSGSVTVAKTADGYAVTFDCTTPAGSLKGNYSGGFTSR